MNSGSYCSACGERLQAETKYCNRCGAPIKGEPPSEPTQEMTQQEIDYLNQMRKEKDLFFRHHPQSPIPPNIRSEFKGLNYFPADPSYRFLCPLTRYPSPPAFKMMTSTGQERDYLKVGYVQFIIQGKTQTLQAYKAAGEHTHEEERKTFFIPFKDTTSGKETYDAARCLEMEEAEDGLFLLDFNKAYNPFCAYSEAYSCPFPPGENWLEVPIRAGEKKFKE